MDYSASEYSTLLLTGVLFLYHQRLKTLVCTCSYWSWGVPYDSWAPTMKGVIHVKYIIHVYIIIRISVSFRIILRKCVGVYSLPPPAFCCCSIGWCAGGLSIELTGDTGIWN